LEYDCVTCTNKERYKRRICFLKQREYDLNFQVLGSSQREVERRRVTKEEVINYLIDVHKMTPSLLITDILMNDARMRLGDRGETVCPICLLDYETDFLVSLETAASKYHSLPFEGAYLDQPLYIIEAFDICRAAEAKYNNYKLNQIKVKTDKTPSKPVTLGKGKK